MHTTMTVTASLTWNLIEGSIHLAARGEEGETLAVEGTRFNVHLEELPAVGDELDAVAHAVGRELILMAAALREARRHQGS